MTFVASDYSVRYRIFCRKGYVANLVIVAIIAMH